MENELRPLSGKQRFARIFLAVLTVLFIVMAAVGVYVFFTAKHSHVKVEEAAFRCPCGLDLAAEEAGDDVKYVGPFIALLK